MTFRAPAATIVTLLLAFWANCATAETAWSVMAKVGAGGAWAAICSAQPSSSNWFLTYYADKTGIARRLANRGPAETKLNNTIDSAQYLTPTTFLMRIRNDDANWGSNNGVTFDTIVEIGPRGMRTLASSRISDGVQLIKDGNFTSNGQPVATFQRCK
jgi:hypothetical protein